MKNRFNVEIKKGFKVICQHARDGKIVGVIEKITHENGRGKVVTLTCGMTCHADDVIHAIDVDNLFFVEFTDTFGGEANYSWVKRFMVSAKTMRGAISKVTRETGHYARKNYDTGELACYSVPGACLCYFVSRSDGSELAQYGNIKEL